MEQKKETKEDKIKNVKSGKEETTFRSCGECLCIEDCKENVKKGFHIFHGENKNCIVTKKTNY